MVLEFVTKKFVITQFVTAKFVVVRLALGLTPMITPPSSRCTTSGGCGGGGGDDTTRGHHCIGDWWGANLRMGVVLRMDATLR